MIGEILGHYRILEKLGEGGMGEVYLAVDHQLDRRVALKILPQSMAEDRERLERFRREAKALACLDHPNIITIHSVETITDHHFLVMELLEGQTLGDFLPKQGVSVAQFFELATPLADALAAAHEKGITHRDLKPSNIIVTKNQRVKVLDFGLARLKPPPEETADTEDTTEPLTGHGQLMGTIPYMAPEQLKGSRGDSRSDLFSLGVILYQMATGKRPFRGGNAIEVQSAILRDKPVPIDSIRRDMPHHVARLVAMCLHKDPDRRMQSAKDLRNELVDLKLELTTQDRLPPPAPERPRRQRTLLIVVTMSIMIVALVGIFRSGNVPKPPATDTPVSQVSNQQVQSLLDQAHLAELRGDLKKNLDEAEERYERAYEIDPNDPVVLGRLALFLSRRQLMQPDSDRPARIRELSDASLQRDPANLHAWLALGNLGLLEDELTTAEDAAVRLIDSFPNDPGGYSLLGRVRMRQNRLDEALTELRKGVSLAGIDTQPRIVLARALWDLGSTNEAASEYEKILQYSPNDPSSLNNLAIIYGQQGRYLDAIPLLRRLLNLSKEKTAAINLANCYFYLGRFEEAIATYNLVLELDPGSPTASHGLADAYEKIGDPTQSRLFLEKAVTGYDEVLAITGPHSFYLSNRAVCAAKLGSFTEAIDNVHEAERLAPQSSAVHFKASEVYALAGNWESAYDYMERSIQNGYSRQEFENSPVFASHLDDPEFRRILESGID